jgi:hypothetical protein
MASSLVRSCPGKKAFYNSYSLTMPNDSLKRLYPTEQLLTLIAPIGTFIRAQE